MHFILADSGCSIKKMQLLKKIYDAFADECMCWHTDNTAVDNFIYLCTSKINMTINYVYELVIC